MKNRFAGVVLFVAVCLWGVGAQSGTLVRNPSFEDAEKEMDNPYGDMAAHWGRWGNWMNRETEWKPTHSGKCILGYHHWEISEAEGSGIYQDIEEVEPNSACKFTIFVAKDQKTNIESVELRLEQMGGFKTLASTVYTADQIKGTGWNELSVVGTNPEPGVRIVVAITPSPGGEREGAIKLDDAALEVE